MNRMFLKKESGFTLVELMVTVFLTAIAVVSIYRGYVSFSQSADAQQQLIEMQQNLRIGISMLTQDIRRAGMNEENEDAAQFLTAEDDNMEIAMDLLGGEHDGLDNDGDGDIDEPGERDGEDNDGDKEVDEEDETRIGDGDIDDDGERVRYTRYHEDADNDGVLDPGEDLNGNGKLDVRLLRREVWDAASAAYKTPVTVITNVDALNFVYYDKDGAPLTIPLTGADLENVDRVEVTLVVRTTNEDYRITNSLTYQNLAGADIYTAPGDNFRRRAFSMNIQIRNNI